MQKSPETRRRCLKSYSNWSRPNDRTRKNDGDDDDVIERMTWRPRCTKPKANDEDDDDVVDVVNFDDVERLRSQ